MSACFNGSLGVELENQRFVGIKFSTHKSYIYRKVYVILYRIKNPRVGETFL